MTNLSGFKFLKISRIIKNYQLLKCKYSNVILIWFDYKSYYRFVNYKHETWDYIQSHMKTVLLAKYSNKKVILKNTCRFI